MRFKNLKLYKIIFFPVLLFCSLLFLTACNKEKEAIPGTVYEIGDLPGKRVGVLTDSQADLYATDLELPSGTEEPSIIRRYTSLDTAVDDLQEGILDCIIMDSSLTDSYCEAYDNLAVLDEAFAWEEYCICLGADQTEFASQLNQALALLEEDGTLLEITERYIKKEVTESAASEDVSGKPSESGSSVSGKQLLRVSTSSGFEPYVYYDENGTLTGFDIDVAYALADQLGMEIEITDMNYSDLFTSITDGTTDFAIAGIFPAEDLMENFLFTDSYTTACQMVLVRK